MIVCTLVSFFLLVTLTSLGLVASIRLSAIFPLFIPLWTRSPEVIKLTKLLVELLIMNLQYRDFKVSMKVVTSSKSISYDSI